MKKFDLIATNHFPVATGLHGNMLGIVNKITENKVIFNVIWSKYGDKFQPPYFLGMELEVKKYEINWMINDIAFPYDFPGYLLYGHTPMDMDKFREPYLLSNKQRFIDLTTFIKYHQKEDTFENLIIKFMEINNWVEDWFLQGLKKTVIEI